MGKTVDSSHSGRDAMGEPWLSRLLPFCLCKGPCTEQVDPTWGGPVWDCLVDMVDPIRMSTPLSCLASCHVKTRICYRHLEGGCLRQGSDWWSTIRQLATQDGRMVECWIVLRSFDGSGWSVCLLVGWMAGWMDRSIDRSRLDCCCWLTCQGPWACPWLPS